MKCVLAFEQLRLPYLIAFTALTLRLLTLRLWRHERFAVIIALAGRRQ